MSSIYLLFWKYINLFKDYIKNIFFIFKQKWLIDIKLIIICNDSNLFINRIIPSSFLVFFILKSIINKYYVSMESIKNTNL